MARRTGSAPVASRPGASAAPLLATLDALHTLPGRVRFRYRLAAGAAAAHEVERALRHAPGVVALRANERIRSLAVAYDPQLTDPGRLRRDLLACPPHAGNGGGGAGTLAAVARSGGLLLFGGALPQGLRLPATLGAARPLLACPLQPAGRQN